MSDFSYNSENLTIPLNQVRLIIGDVNSTDAVFCNDEIDFFISEEANIYGASAIAKRAHAAKVFDKVSKTVGKLKIELQQQHEHLLKEAEILDGKSNTKGAPQLFAGGLSISGKEAERADTDRVDPKFTRDQDQFPGTGENSIGGTS